MKETKKEKKERKENLQTLNFAVLSSICAAAMIRSLA